MQFILRLNTEGAAFAGADDDYGPGPEVARILRELGDVLDYVGEPAEFAKLSGTVRDFNGNTAGRWAFGTGSWDVANETLLAGMEQPHQDTETLTRVRDILTNTDWSGVMFDNEALAAIAEAVDVDRQD